MLDYVSMQEVVYGCIYRFIRFFVKRICFFVQFICGKPRDLESAIVVGHGLLGVTQALKLPVYIGSVKQSLQPVEVYDLTFANPLTFAAYESNLRLLNLFFRLGIGGGCYKTMMVDSRLGNARPRIQEIKYNNNVALVNAMGLPGYGAKASIDAILASELCEYGRPLGLSLGGESPLEYVDTFNVYDQVIGANTYPFYYEINMSCPNTDKGKQLAQDVTLLADILTLLRQKTKRVISVKVSPDQPLEQLHLIADMLTGYESMILNIGNTQLKTCEQLGLPPQALSRGAGGLSGRPLFEKTAQLVGQLNQHNVVLLATGGIDDSAKVRHVLDQGASLVGMASALVFNPYCIPKMLKQL